MIMKKQTVRLATDKKLEDWNSLIDFLVESEINIDDLTNIKFEFVERSDGISFTTVDYVTKDIITSP